jgi:hypothetical protein
MPASLPAGTAIDVPKPFPAEIGFNKGVLIPKNFCGKVSLQ